MIYVTRKDRAATIMCCDCGALTCISGFPDDPELHAKMHCWRCGSADVTVRFAWALVGVRFGGWGDDDDRPAPETAPAKPVARKPAPPQLSLF